MQDFIITLLNMSITASVIAAVVMLLRLIFRKTAPKRLIVVLWALVAIRLVCPVQIQTDISLMPQKPVQMVQEYHNEYVSHKQSAVKDTANELQKEPAPEQGNEPEYEPQYEADDAEKQGGAAAVTENLPEKNTESGEKNVTAERKTISAWEIAGIVWAVGAAAMLIYMAVSYILLHRQVSASIKREGNVRIADDISTSFILGIFRPRIFVPSYLSESEVQYVLAHERRHIRHLDHIWKPLGFILLSANWFNPVMWVSYVLLCKDIELACDESVISRLDTDGRKEYSTVLLKCSMERHIITACPIAFGETGVKERVKAMKNYKKPTIIIIIAVVLAGIVTAVLLLTAPKAEKANNDSLNNATSSQSARFEQNDDLFNAPLPLKDGEELLTEWSYAKAMTDVDNDGKADRVTYACVGEEGTSVIIVEFGDAAKELVRTELEGDIIHPTMVLSKNGKDNLIYLYEISQGSEFGYFIYAFGCDTKGNIKSFDGKTDISRIYDAQIKFDNLAGSVKILDSGDAEVTLNGTDKDVTVLVPSVLLEQHRMYADYQGELYPRLHFGDEEYYDFGIDADTNTIHIEMAVCIYYDFSYSYDILCVPANAELVLEYKGGEFVRKSLTFSVMPEFEEYTNGALSTSEPSAIAEPTPTPTPSATNSGVSYKFDGAAKKELDLDGDGKKEQIIIGNDSNSSNSVDSELRLTIKSSDDKVIYKSYTDEGDWYYYYAYRIWIADISGDGRLAVFVDYKTESGALSTIGFFVKAGKTEKIKSKNLTDMDGGSYLGNGIQSIKNGKIVVMKLDDLLGTWGWTMKGRFDTDKNRIVYQKKATRTYAADSYSPVLTTSTYAYDESGKKVDLPTGRAYQPIESDFATYAWIQDETGAKYKIEIARKGGWTYTINGIEQDELFEEGLPYAG